MSTTTEAQARTWRLMDIEDLLAEMDGETGLMSHLIGSKLGVTDESWSVVQEKLRELRRQLSEAWQGALDERRAEHEAHEAELAKAKAEAKAARGIPGSPAQVAQARAYISTV